MLTVFVVLKLSCYLASAKCIFLHRSCEIWIFPRSKKLLNRVLYQCWIKSRNNIAFNQKISLRNDKCDFDKNTIISLLNISKEKILIIWEHCSINTNMIKIINILKIILIKWMYHSFYEILIVPKFYRVLFIVVIMSYWH